MKWLFNQIKTVQTRGKKVSSTDVTTISTSTAVNTNFQLQV